MRAAIFDLDGVLLRSEPLWQRGFADTLNRYCRDAGRPDPRLTPEGMRRYEGGRVPDTVRAVLEGLGYAVDAAAVDALTDEVVGRVSEAVDHRRHAIHDSVRVAHELAARGVLLGVASSSAQEFVDAAVRELGLSGVVAVTQSALRLEHGKPHPEVYRLTLRRLGVTPGECVAVEDSVTGLLAALRAGLACVWLREGDHGVDDLDRRLGGEEVPGRVRCVTDRLTVESVLGAG